MQLKNLYVEPSWYFIFGPPEKSSLAEQFATEHKLLHLNIKHFNESTLKDHVDVGLVIECSAAIFREAEPLNVENFVVFLEGELTADEIQIRKDYERLGRSVTIKTTNYKLFRKEVYPKLIILFGPSKPQIQFLCESYFYSSGYLTIKDTLTANDILSRLPKYANYVLLGFIPHPQELAVLEEFFHIQVIHLKHQRTELSNFQDFFNLQAKIVPEISKKPYFHSFPASIPPNELGAAIGQCILPQLIFVNAQDKEENAGLIEHVTKTDGLLLSFREIESICKKKKIPLRTGPARLADLVTIIFLSSLRKQIFITDYPDRPEEFFILKDKTRPLTLFADCLKTGKYEYSKQLNPAIYFLQTHKRKHIELDYSFEKQIISSIKYLVVSGPPCIGKTSAAKYISSAFGYRHIEYDTYIASIKEKLIAPEDGEELPFHKIIKHFNSLILASGETPILIDGFNIDWKDIDNWVRTNGPPTVFNLKTDQKELIRRTRRKNEADVNAEVTEEEAVKIRELIAKNSDWADQFSARCPNTTLYQIDFTPQLILAEKLLDQILKPRIFLIQENNTLLYQNIAVKYNLGYFDLKRESLKDIAVSIRKGNYRNVLLCNYSQNHDHLVCQDFHQIEKNLGTIRYLSIWTPQAIEANDQNLHLEPPPKVEKPKAAEGGEEAEAPPPAEEEGQAKKKVFNVFEYTWTKPGNQKNISQWFYKLKKNITRRQNSVINCFNGFEEVLRLISQNKELTIYESIVA